MRRVVARVDGVEWVAVLAVRRGVGLTDRRGDGATAWA